jgi:hypothetical protein
MPGFLRSRWFWIISVLTVVLVGGYFAMQGQGADKKKKTDAAAKLIAPSPFAAIANGKADVEGGIIQVAARRGGVVKAVFVEEGQSVLTIAFGCTGGHHRSVSIAEWTAEWLRDEGVEPRVRHRAVRP